MLVWRYKIQDIEVVNGEAALWGFEGRNKVAGFLIAHVLLRTTRLVLWVVVSG